MYVNRETGLLRDSLSTTTWHRQRRPSVKPGQEVGVAMVARPTASKRWRLDRKHGRRRPTAGVTTTEQQRPVRQEETATRLGHSRRRYVNDVRPTTSPSHSRLDSTTPVDGSTTTRPSHSVGLTPRQLQHRLLWLLSFATGTAQLYSSSVPITLCLGSVSVHVNRLTELLWRTLTRRSLKYIYTQCLSRVNSQLILTRRYLAHAGIGCAPARAL